MPGYASNWSIGCDEDEEENEDEDGGERRDAWKEFLRWQHCEWVIVMDIIFFLAIWKYLLCLLISSQQGRDSTWARNMSKLLFATYPGSVTNNVALRIIVVVLVAAHCYVVPPAESRPCNVCWNMRCNRLEFQHIA